MATQVAGSGSRFIQQLSLGNDNVKYCSTSGWKCELFSSCHYLLCEQIFMLVYSIKSHPYKTFFCLCDISVIFVSNSDCSGLGLVTIKYKGLDWDLYSERLKVQIFPEGIQHSSAWIRAFGESGAFMTKYRRCFNIWCLYEPIIGNCYYLKLPSDLHITVAFEV